MIAVRMIKSYARFKEGGIYLLPSDVAIALIISGVAVWDHERQPGATHYR